MSPKRYAQLLDAENLQGPSGVWLPFEEPVGDDRGGLLGEHGDGPLVSWRER